MGGGRLVHEVERLAVLRAGRIGDFVVAVPALEALRRAYPDAELVVLGDAWLEGFLRGRPGPWDRVVVAPWFPGLRGRPSDAACGDDVEPFLQAHRGRYDVVLQMHGGGRNSNELAALLQPRVSAGTRTPDARPLDRWIPYAKDRPEVLRWLEVASLVGAPPPNDLAGLAPRLLVTPADLDESRRSLPEETAYVVLHAGAQDATRRWPTERFAELGRRLHERYDARVVLVGSEQDAAASAEAARRIGPAATDLTGCLSLGGLLGLASRSVLMVGNDSGPRHLAAATGVPTVGIFWVGNVVTFGPLVGGTDQVVVGDPVADVAVDDVLAAAEVAISAPR